MMNSNQPSTKLSLLPRVPLLALLILSFLGFADAAYLTADHYLKLPLPCSLTQGCDLVLTSKYATIGGLPIALFGALYYLVILFLSLYVYTVYTSQNPNLLAVRAIFGLTLTSLAIYICLVYLQIFVIKALCMYCLGSALVTLILFIFSWVLLRTLRA